MPSRHAFLAAAVVAALSAHAAVAANTSAAATSLADCTSRFVALSDAGKLGGVTWGEFRATVCGLPIAPAKGAGTGTAVAGTASAGAGLPAASQAAGPSAVKAPAGPSVKVMTKQFGKAPPGLCSNRPRIGKNGMPVLRQNRSVSCVTGKKGG
ncbi:MAG: hypothetical protein JSR87_11140 [Proteobacteria bacterium]|nr:hypothetical protein [Pseudomonadota bacterium]MBS0572544.1 hypothetical protein [Pseudomonadota bacterium]